MAASFTITTAADHVALDGERHVTVPFTVANDTGLAIDVQAQAVPVEGTDPGWFSVVAPALVHMAAGGRNTYAVEVHVPASAAAGDYAFFLVASDVLNPEDRYADGPRVTFHVGGPPPPPPPPPTSDAGYLPAFLGAFLGDLVLVVVVGLITGVVVFASFHGVNAGNFWGDVFGTLVAALVLAALVMIVALFIGGPLGAGLGAFLVLRARRYEAAGWTGVAVGLAQLVVVPLGLILLALARNLAGPVVGVMGTLVVLVSFIVPAAVGRGIVLLIRGQFVWPWVDIFRPRAR